MVGLYYCDWIENYFVCNKSLYWNDSDSYIVLETFETSKAYGQPGNYVMGANIAGFIKVAKAMTAFGIV